MANLDIASSRSDDALTLTVSGELDMESSPELLDAIRRGLKDTVGLKIDLKDVSYVDSSGIAVLIQGYKIARKNQHAFVLCDPSPQVLAVIELSHLKDFFEFESSEEDP